MNTADRDALVARFRSAVAGAGWALSSPAPGVALVRLDQPTPPPPPHPGPRRMLPAPEQPTDPVCRWCKTRHQPIPHQGGTGAADLYGRQLLPDPGRPTPLNRTADDSALSLFSRHRPWQ
jgi:hypothetical protein